MTKSKFIIIVFIALFLEAILCFLTPSLFPPCTRDVFADEGQYYIGNRKCRPVISNTLRDGKKTPMPMPLYGWEGCKTTPIV